MYNHDETIIIHPWCNRVHVHVDPWYNHGISTSMVQPWYNHSSTITLSYDFILCVQTEEESYIGPSTTMEQLLYCSIAPWYNQVPNMPQTMIVQAICTTVRFNHKTINGSTNVQQIQTWYSHTSLVHLCTCIHDWHDGTIHTEKGTNMTQPCTWPPDKLTVTLPALQAQPLNQHSPTLISSN